MIVARLYQRASKEVSFVRTGFGGQRVIMNGGALVLPVLHEIIQVNMNTLRLEVRRSAEQALITKDRMRVDVQAEFYVRVQPTVESIANAAQTLGRRTMEPATLKELVEGKFVDALRAVAAEMAMEELHEQRVNFVQKVQAAVSEDILKNGLELESVSLTGLDQTNREFFNPENVFDAEGLTKMTQAIEERRKTRNDIEQNTQVAIAKKNLEAQTEQYNIHRDTEYARLNNEREIAIRVDQQNAEIESLRAQRATESEAARTLSRQQIREAAIVRGPGDRHLRAGQCRRGGAQVRGAVAGAGQGRPGACPCREGGRRGRDRAFDRDRRALQAHRADRRRAGRREGLDQHRRRLRGREGRPPRTAPRPLVRRQKARPRRPSSGPPRPRSPTPPRRRASSRSTKPPTSSRPSRSQ